MKFSSLIRIVYCFVLINICTDVMIDDICILLRGFSAVNLKYLIILAYTIRSLLGDLYRACRENE